MPNSLNEKTSFIIKTLFPNEPELTSEALTFIKLHEPILTEILTVLKKNELIKEEEIIDRLNMAIDENLMEFRNHVMLLNDVGFLNSSSLVICLKSIIGNTYRREDETSERGTASNLLFLIEQLHQNSLIEPSTSEPSTLIKRETINQLFLLSNSNLKRINLILSTLMVQGLLNDNSLQEAIKRITKKLPEPEIVKVVKIRRKNSQLSRSKFQLEKNDISFFCEHRENGYPRGTFGYVKKAYTKESASSEEATFGVKKLFCSAGKNSEEELNETNTDLKKEGRGSLLLNRQTFCFFNNKGKLALVYEWQNGKELSKFSKFELKELPLKNRCISLKTFFDELNTLHSHYRVHNDIKPRNCILDPKAPKLTIIDLDGLRKNKTKNDAIFTPGYVDENMKTFHGDLYGAGIVTASMFPELFLIELLPFNTQVIIVKQKEQTPFEQAIINLVNSMMDKDISKRCTSQDALSYITQLIDIINSPSSQKSKEIDLERIAQATIYHTKPTIEDVLRDAHVPTIPKKFMRIQVNTEAFDSSKCTASTVRQDSDMFRIGAPSI